MGAFVGLRSVATRDDMLRAVFEGLDYQFLDILEGLERGLAFRAKKIIAIGGAIHNEFWMQNKADVARRPVEVPAIEEATPLGAAILAGIGTGLYKDEEEAYARVHRPGRVYEPDPALEDTYRRGFELYRQVYPSLKDLHGKVFEQSV
jgi:xylulokinase